MRKITAVLACIFLMLLSGCNSNKILNTGKTVVPNQLEVKEGMNLEESIGDGLFYAIVSYFGTQEDENVIYDTSTKKIINIDYPEWSYGSSSYVVLNDKYYTWLLDEEYMKLIKMDLKSGDVNIIAKQKEKTPMAELISVSDAKFLSYYSIQTDSDDGNEYATLSVAYLYDTEGKHKEIIREKFENNQDWQNSKGILIEGMYLSDGKLFAIGRQKEDGEYTFYKYEYDLKGKLKTRTEIVNFDQIIGAENLLEIVVSGRALVFRTAETLNAYVCDIKNNKVSKIAEGSISYDLITCKNKSTSKEYLAFVESNVNSDDTIKDEACSLKLMDTQSGEIKSVGLTLPYEKPYFVDMKVLASGDILLKYCDGKYDPQNIGHFIIKNEELYNNVILD